MNQHNAFLLIPAYIVNHSDIDNATAILFGRLNALSNQQGYCFATDVYLAEICKCKKRVISDRLKLLEDLGFIKRRTIKKGFGWERKIWTCNHYSAMKECDIQKSFTNSMPVPFERHARAEEKNKKEKNKKNPPPSLPKKEEEDFLFKNKNKKLWLEKNRSEEDFEKVFSIYLEQPDGNVKDFVKWSDTVYRNLQKQRFMEELMVCRRRYSEKQVNWHVDEKGVTVISGAIQEHFLFNRNEEFWKKHKLDKEYFKKYKEHLATKES